jgi:hypothetical protein
MISPVQQKVSAWSIDSSLVTIRGLPPNDPDDDEDESEEDEEDAAQAGRRQLRQAPTVIIPVLTLSINAAIIRPQRAEFFSAVWSGTAS